MRIKAMAEHFLLEAAVSAAQNARPEDGLTLEKGASFTPAEFAAFKAALAILVGDRMVQLERRGVIASGNILPQELRVA